MAPAEIPRLTPFRATPCTVVPMSPSVAGSSCTGPHAPRTAAKRRATRQQFLVLLNSVFTLRSLAPGVEPLRGRAIGSRGVRAGTLDRVPPIPQAVVPLGGE